MNKNLISYIKIALFTLFLLIIDQITKAVAVVCLKGKNEIPIIKDVLTLKYLEGGNTGAAWGMFSGQITMFIVFTVVASALIILFIVNTQKVLVNNYSLKNTTLLIFRYFLAMLLAGALGNLIDRIVLGYVIDFIYFKLINFPIFNIADCYVTVSCVLLVIISIFKLKDTDFNQIFTLKLKKGTK